MANWVFQIIILMTRSLACFAVMPAISGKFFPQRAKVILAFFIALILQKSVTLPEYYENIWMIFGYIATEVLIGLVIGLSAKIYYEALSVVGTIVSMQAGLSMANFFSVEKVQESAFSNILFINAIAMIFLTDTHHIFLYGVVSSYQKFPISMTVEISEFSSFITTIVSESFIFAFQIAAPFLVVGTALMVGAGFLSRLLPTLQVFFVITPVQIFVMMTILLLVFDGIMIKLIAMLEKAANIIFW